uniref:Putative secreted protein n=1 Tax=Anopheles darlingi TaxID=43151 RepID=A0A2M4D583_ANODA
MFTFTVFTAIVMPSMTFCMKLYEPCGAAKLDRPAVGVPLRAISHVSIVMFTSSSVNTIGVLFSLVQDIRNDTWLHQADVSRSQAGSSSSSVSTFSSSCRFDSSPSPRNALRFTLSGDKFFV